MKKWICINIYHYPHNVGYIDTWWYNTTSQIDLDELYQDLAFFKSRNRYYNLYEVIK